MSTNENGAFHHFQKLPAEIRVKIWEDAFYQSRRIIPLSLSLYSSPRSLPTPGLLGTCHESRHMITSKYGYESAFTSRWNTKGTWFFPGFDIAYLSVFCDCQYFDSSEASAASSLPQCICVPLIGQIPQYFGKISSTRMIAIAVDAFIADFEQPRCTRYTAYHASDVRDAYPEFMLKFMQALPQLEKIVLVTQSEDWLAYRWETKTGKRRLLAKFQEVKKTYPGLKNYKIPDIVEVRPGDIATFERYEGLYEPALADDNSLVDTNETWTWDSILNDHLMMLDRGVKDFIHVKELSTLQPEEQQEVLAKLRRMSYTDRERCLWQYFTFGQWWPNHGNDLPSTNTTPLNGSP